MAWHVVSYPSSARDLLRNGSGGSFSPVQKIGAAVWLYATLPLYDRVRLVQEYLAQGRAKQGDSRLPSVQVTATPVENP
jgi:hypothetical protein